MPLRDDLNGALQDLERELRGPDHEPPRLTYGALTVPCIPTTVENGVVIDAEGNAITVRLSVFVRLEHFELPGLQAVDADSAPAAEEANAVPIPTVGRLVRVRWTDYRVVAVRFDSAHAAVRLDLADPGSNQ